MKRRRNLLTVTFLQWSGMRCGRERTGKRMDYTLDDLKAELAATKPGEETCVAYGQYALLFPPGEPD